jgi:gas vesicle protein
MNELEMSTLPEEPAGDVFPQAAVGTEELAMRNESSHTLMVFLLGAVAGGVTALLFAPTSGRELRDKIGEGANKARDSALESAKQARVKATETYEAGTERARELKDSAKENAEVHVKAVKQAVKKGKAAYDKELAKAH